MDDYINLTIFQFNVSEAAHPDGTVGALIHNLGYQQGLMEEVHNRIGTIEGLAEEEITRLTEE